MLRTMESVTKAWTKEMCCKGSQQVKDSEGDSDTSWICVYVSFLSTRVYMNISMNDLTYKYVLNVQANTL